MIGFCRLSGCHALLLRQLTLLPTSVVSDRGFAVFDSPRALTGKDVGSWLTQEDCDNAAHKKARSVSGLITQLFFKTAVPYVWVFFILT